MKIFKFGGASVKDADGVKNVAKVLENQGFEKCILVVSAMGKTTNALEKVVKNYFENSGVADILEEIKNQHINIAKGLFDENDEVFAEISLFFDDIESFLRRNKSPNYNFVYDQVVSCGEMISSKILSAFLNKSGYTNEFLDARDFIKTDNNYREGIVNWAETEKNISKIPMDKSYLTQGFIGSDENNFTVTLGREGSDYTGAIFAYCIGAESVTIWKDVPGVMTGDPNKFADVHLLDQISYEEAIEMAYYGASVIHPKTLQPLKQKNIPFFVKSFVKPEEKGTQISAEIPEKKVPTFILKENQNLLKITTKDFSFIAEDHISYLFSELAKLKIKVSLMQTSAITLALCTEDKYGKLEDFVKEIQAKFNVEILKNVALFTIRNAEISKTEVYKNGKNVIVEQLSGDTLQIVTN